jgi:high-affinity Fe2+/Pb2+ permease
LGRNNVISAVAGGVIGLVGGGVAAATLDIMGLSALGGAGFGFISGVLIGILSGMMSGARSPKKPLRELAAELDRGKVIVTVGVDTGDQVRLVEDVLERAGGRRVGNA